MKTIEKKTDSEKTTVKKILFNPTLDRSNVPFDCLSYLECLHELKDAKNRIEFLMNSCPVKPRDAGL